jgi:hypothetical protein
MAFRLRKDFPEYYYRIIELFRKNKVPLMKDYYYWSTVKKEDQMVLHYNLSKVKPAQRTNLNGGRNAEPVFEFKNTRIIKEYLSICRVVAHINKADALINDITLLENSIQRILMHKFSKINKEYLYQRDILSACYNETVFADSARMDDVQLVAVENSEIVKTNFDWTLLDEETDSLVLRLQKIIESEREFNNLVIIPECDKVGFSLVSIDDLDIFVLELLRKPMSVNRLLKEAAKAFDPDELISAYEDYKLLIFGRIKIALLNKLIKPLGE